MSALTTDPTDPRLGRGHDAGRVPQNAAYLVLSAEERAKGFVRPVRLSYVHVSIAGPKYPLRELTPAEAAPHREEGWTHFEEYPRDGSHGSALGRYWSREDLDRVGKGCGAVTKMGREIAETYARQPGFYGATYCCNCSRHIDVGRDGEFVWEGTDERVGT